jgi:FkbM family methyltransferase
METFSTPCGPFSCLKNDQNFYIHLKSGSFWEVNLIMKLLKPYWEKAGVILDIGAHIGSHSFVYSFFNRESIIYAFEPQVEIYKVLCENMHTRTNVICVNTCVGHTLCNTNMSTHTHFGENVDKAVCYGEGPVMNLGGMSLGREGEKVAMITIDSLNLTRCDYVKIDVEGAESLVLMGARKTFTKYKPIICFEYSPSFDTTKMANLFGMEKLPDVFDLLREFGYTEFQLIEGENWLALPKVSS